MNNDTSILTKALSLIASPMRPDGTWNRDRQACQLLAEEALRKIGYYGESPNPRKGNLSESEAKTLVEASKTIGLNLGGIAAFLDAHPIKK